MSNNEIQVVLYECHNLSYGTYRLVIVEGFGEGSACTSCQGDTLKRIHDMLGISLSRWIGQPLQMVKCESLE